MKAFTKILTMSIALFSQASMASDAATVWPGAETHFSGEQACSVLRSVGVTGFIKAKQEISSMLTFRAARCSLTSDCQLKVQAFNYNQGKAKVTEVFSFDVSDRKRTTGVSDELKAMNEPGGEQARVFFGSMRFKVLDVMMLGNQTAMLKIGTAFKVANSEVSPFSAALKADLNVVFDLNKDGKVSKIRFANVNPRLVQVDEMATDSLFVKGANYAMSTFTKPAVNALVNSVQLQKMNFPRAK
ncbi:MAG: hypothetical protein IPJ84_09295 [Bdellovibrionales bacterium]|nr:hypothetical protein [Bdellovibrionales bacterium]